MVPTTHQLELLSDSTLRLAFGDHEDLRARLTDRDGVAVPDAKVSFALVGRAQDSSLSSLDVSTDGDGVATNMLTAGRVVATFRVRTSAQGALDEFTDVAVSNAGFGTLSANVAYKGKRAVMQRVVFVQADLSCQHAARMPGDPTVTLNDKNDVARFLALPAGTSYAVTAIAQGAGDTVLARGCSDGVAIDADSEAMIDLSFADEPLHLAGQFLLAATLDSSAPASVLVGALRSATRSLVQDDAQGQALPDAEGRFLLDSLDGTLRSDAYAKQSGVSTLVNALSQARMAQSSAGTLEHSLQMLLKANSQGPLAAIPRIAEFLQKSLGSMRLSAVLALSSKDKKRPLSWQAQRIEALPITTGSAPPFVDLTPFSDMTQLQASFTPEQDLLRLSTLHQRAQFGTLSAQALTQVVSSDPGGHGPEIRNLIGCATLGEWLGKQTLPQNAACDGACIQAVCDRALTRLTGAGQTALLAFDQTRPTLTLQGDLELDDADGDLVPEQLTAHAFLGQWDGAMAGAQGDALSAPESATVVMPH
jgi:hypothetical protein